MTAADRPTVTAPDGLPCCGACEGFPECTCGNEGTDCRTAADRPSVTDDARAEAERRWGDRRTSDRLPIDWLDEGMASGFVLGAQWAAGPAETTTATDEADTETVARVLSTDGLREQVRRAVQGVVWNASNHPDPVAVLGRDITPLTDRVTDALMPLIAQAQADALTDAADDIEGMGVEPWNALTPAIRHLRNRATTYTERTDR